MESLDSLPYVDPPVSEEERKEILISISRVLPAGYQNKLHPSLSSLPDPKFTPLLQAEIERKARAEPGAGGIDMSRYEAPDEPSNEDEFTWRSALEAAYRSNSYLDGRQTNLSLLEEYGKNTWLIGNSQLESLLQQLEKELAALKEDIDTVNKSRKSVQEGSRGELVGLEESWRRGVGRLIELQVATDGLRQEVTKSRRVN